MNKPLKLNLQLFASPTGGNQNLITKAAINTAGEYGSSGLLRPADAERFIDMIQKDASFLGRLDSETVSRKEGTVSKLGVGTRLLRQHREGEDSVAGNEVVPVIGEVPYKCEYYTLGTSLTEEWLEQNKEREGFVDHFMGQIASQLGVDILDLAFNGDEATPTSATDYNFLRLNDGFIKQIKSGGHVVDGATINGGKFSKKMFYDLRRAIPKEYRTSTMKWICSDDTYTDLSEYLSERPTSLGDIAITKGDNDIMILQTPFERVPNFPDDVIIYADPKNLKLVYFLQISHRRTAEGKEAIYQRKRFYATHLAIDFIIKEVKATAILINRGSLA